MRHNELKMLFKEEQIRQRVKEIGAQISHDYRERTPHLFAILENGFVFMADLIRAIPQPVLCHFLKAEIRDVPGTNVPLREILFTPKIDAEGKDIIFVDGILQSGIPLDHLVRYVSAQNPRSVRTAILVEKTEGRKVDVPLDYVGFKVESKFVVGYGLGYQEKYRHLPYLATIA